MQPAGRSISLCYLWLVKVVCIDKECSLFIAFSELRMLCYVINNQVFELYFFSEWSSVCFVRCCYGSYFLLLSLIFRSKCHITVGSCVKRIKNTTKWYWLITIFIVTLLSPWVSAIAFSWSSFLGNFMWVALLRRAGRVYYFNTPSVTGFNSWLYTAFLKPAICSLKHRFYPTKILSHNY